jgi:heptosyltransferase-2
MVMAQSLFKVLKQRDPACQLDVLAPGWSLPIVARMPEIRDGIAAQTAHGKIGLRARRRVAVGLRAADYDRAIVLPRSFKAALVPWFARIPQRTGYRGEARFGLINDVRPFDAQVLDQTVKRFIALGLETGEPLPADLPFPKLAISLRNQQRVSSELGVSTDRPVVAMMPGAEYGPAKCWPLRHFRDLARSLGDAGYAVWVLGSAKDDVAGEEIAADSPAVNLCGKTSLEDVIDLLAACEQAVSNDSGLMHIAAAVGTHVHAIYGSSSPKFTPPLAKRHDIHHLGLNCSPCYERECPLGHLNCLNGIRPSDILQKILEKDG